MVHLFTIIVTNTVLLHLEMGGMGIKGTPLSHNLDGAEDRELRFLRNIGALRIPGVQAANGRLINVRSRAAIET